MGFEFEIPILLFVHGVENGKGHVVKHDQKKKKKDHDWYFHLSKPCERDWSHHLHSRRVEKEKFCLGMHDDKVAYTNFSMHFELKYLY